jgi:hypothetical protein
MGCCRGQCCAAFTLFPHVVENVTKRAASGEAEAAFILAMLVPLTAEQAIERLVALGFDPHVGMTAEAIAKADQCPEPVQHFTCRNWNEASRLCDAYDQRPRMCRGFPYDRTCDACGHPPVPLSVELKVPAG